MVELTKTLGGRFSTGAPDNKDYGSTILSPGANGNGTSRTPSRSSRLRRKKSSKELQREISLPTRELPGTL